MFAHAFSVLAWAAADQAVSSLEYGVIAAGTVVVVATAATTPANHVFARGPVLVRVGHYRFAGYGAESRKDVRIGDGPGRWHDGARNLDVHELRRCGNI